MAKCQYQLAYQGACNADCADRFCTVHQQATCSVCWEQATHECEHAGQFVCGAPLCDNCEGHTDTSKPSGSWGFLNHTHRQKDPSCQTNKGRQKR